MGTWSRTPARPAARTGDATNETADGLAGDDTLNGHGGDDVLHGGANADTLHGGSGSDDLFGDAGDDILIVQEGEDADGETYKAGDGTDTLLVSGSGQPAERHGRRRQRHHKRGLHLGLALSTQRR